MLLSIDRRDWCSAERRIARAIPLVATLLWLSPSTLLAQPAPIPTEASAGLSVLRDQTLSEWTPALFGALSWDQDGNSWAVPVVEGEFAATSQAVANADSTAALIATLTMPQPASSSPQRDSLRNGVLIGAIVGGVTVAVLAGTGCAYSSLLDIEGEDSCGTAIAVGALIGAGLGAAIGAGIDVLIDRSPFSNPVVGGGTAPARIALRCRVTF